MALKTLNQKNAEEDKVKFLQEAAIMAQFRHPNVVLLYGIVSKEEPVSHAIGYIRESCDTIILHINTYTIKDHTCSSSGGKG